MREVVIVNKCLSNRYTIEASQDEGDYYMRLSLSSESLDIHAREKCSYKETANRGVEVQVEACHIEMLRGIRVTVYPQHNKGLYSM